MGGRIEQARRDVGDGEMSKTIEVPDDLYAALKTHAAETGVSLDDYVIGPSPNRASIEELLELLKRIPPVDLGDQTIADIIREGREERTDQILDAITRR